MTPFYPGLGRWILPLCFIPICLDLTAQQNVPPIDASRQTSFITLDPPYSYDATIEARSFILFLQTWAEDLVQRHGLTEDELFICRTIWGDITNPRAEARRHPASCPRIAYTQLSH